MQICSLSELVLNLGDNSRAETSHNLALDVHFLGNKHVDFKRKTKFQMASNNEYIKI